MTLPVRFFFDECLSKPVVERDLVRSLQLYGSEAEIAHLLSKFGSGGVKDPEWVPVLAREKGWVVITSDQGKQSKKSEKLPLICRAFGVTHSDAVEGTASPKYVLQVAGNHGSLGEAARDWRRTARRWISNQHDERFHVPNGACY